MKYLNAPSFQMWFMRLGIAFVGCVGVLYIYWSFAPYNVMTYSDLPYKMSQETYKQGETGHYHITYCKHLDVTPVVTRYYIDGLKIQANDSGSVLQSGCHTQEVSFTIPKSLPPGRWHIQTTASYTVNPVREPIVYSNETEWFNVIRTDVGSYGGDKVEAN